MKPVRLRDLRRIVLPESAEGETEHITALRNTLKVHASSLDSQQVSVPNSIIEMIPPKGTVSESTPSVSQTAPVDSPEPPVESQTAPVVSSEPAAEVAESEATGSDAEPASTDTTKASDAETDAA